MGEADVLSDSEMFERRSSTIACQFSYLPLLPTDNPGDGLVCRRCGNGAGAGGAWRRKSHVGGLSARNLHFGNEIFGIEIIENSSRFGFLCSRVSWTRVVEMRFSKYRYSSRFRIIVFEK